MATGTAGRRYWVELFDVQTFHVRRLTCDVRPAPAVALELAGRSPADIARAELVALLCELRDEHGAGVGLHLAPVSGREPENFAKLFEEAAARVGMRLYRDADTLGHPVAVDAAVLNGMGELVGTTCQAAR